MTVVYCMAEIVSADVFACLGQKKIEFALNNKCMTATHMPW